MKLKSVIFLQSNVNFSTIFLSPHNSEKFKYYKNIENLENLIKFSFIFNFFTRGKCC